MNPREKILGAITVIAVVVGVGWYMGLGDSFDSLTFANDEIDSQREKFDSNLQSLEDIYVIEKKYKTIGQSPLDQDTSKRAISVFDEYVTDLARKRGFPAAQTQTRADVEEIDGIDEYELLSVVVKTEGSYANTVALLKDFEGAGLLFRDLDLRGTRDRDYVIVRATVARIARREIKTTRASNTLFKQ